MSATPGQRLAEARRLVVKVGSSILIDGESGRADEAWLNAFASDVARVRKRGQQVLVVSSGAVALGRRRLGLKRRTSVSSRVSSTWAQIRP